MKVTAQYGRGKVVVSYELFPPKTDQGMVSLREQVSELASCGPTFMTCTYGAGGSTRDRTLEVLRMVQGDRPGLPVASHLTCVGATAEELRAYVSEARLQGVNSIVALRGDPPRGDSTFRAVEGGLRYASELVALVKSGFPELGILVAGYPETHPEAASASADLDNVKRKVDAGADVVVTQLFYDNADFYRFRDACVLRGVHVPIVPGILPVTNLAQVKRFTALCGAKLTRTLLQRLERYEGDEEGMFSVGVYYAARQVEELVEQGAPGVHFYVLNKSRAAALICRALALGEEGGGGG